MDKVTYSGNFLRIKAYVKQVLEMGEITVKARVPKELEGSEKEIEKILRKKVEDTIKRLEMLKKTKGVLKTEKSWQELEAEMYED